MKNLDRKMPLYIKLYDELLKLIQNGNLQEGDKLLAEPDLSIKYKVSRSTIRRAILELVNDGYLEKIHGKGTFVTNPKVQLYISGFLSYRDEMEKNQVRHRTEIRCCELMGNISSKVVKKLNLESDDQVYYVERIRYYEDDPILIERTYLPQKVFFGFDCQALQDQSIYRVFESYNVHSVDGDESYWPYLPKEYEKELLQITDEGVVPCIRMSRLLKSEGVPVEYTVSILKPGKMELKIHISK